MSGKYVSKKYVRSCVVPAKDLHPRRVIMVDGRRFSVIAIIRSEINNNNMPHTGTVINKQY